MILKNELEKVPDKEFMRIIITMVKKDKDREMCVVNPRKQFTLLKKTKIKINYAGKENVNKAVENFHGLSHQQDHVKNRQSTMKDNDEESCHSVN